MNERWLPSDLEDVLVAERGRPVEGAENLERLRTHIEATVGPFDGGGGEHGSNGGSSGDGGAAPGSATGGATGAVSGATKALAAKFAATALTALAIGGVAGAKWEAAREPHGVAGPRSSVAVAAQPAALPSAPAAATHGESSIAVSALPIANDPIANDAPRARAEPAGNHAESLAAERTLVDVARTAASLGKTDEALSALDRHAQRFPKGVMEEEREGLRIEVLASAGRTAEAREGAARFRKRFPMSMLLPAIDAALSSPRDDAGEP